MRVVEVGQYFVTKDTGDFRQFQTVACREYEPSKATEIMILSVESRRNSSGIFSQDSHRCSSVTKSQIC